MGPGMSLGRLLADTHHAKFLLSDFPSRYWIKAEIMVRMSDVGGPGEPKRILRVMLMMR